MGSRAHCGENEGMRLAAPRVSRADRVLGVDRGEDFRFILHLFLGWMSLLADNFQW